jgi:hypothetical protein
MKRKNNDFRIENVVFAEPGIPISSAGCLLDARSECSGYQEAENQPTMGNLPFITP